jgi:hypothetical protein
MRLSSRLAASAVAAGALLLGSVVAAQDCDPDVCANPWSTNGATLKQAKAHCGENPVVWKLAKQRVYHTAASPKFGRAKPGVFMCESAAKRLGARPAAVR